MSQSEYVSEFNHQSEWIGSRELSIRVRQYTDPHSLALIYNRISLGFAYCLARINKFNAEVASLYKLKILDFAVITFNAISYEIEWRKDPLPWLYKPYVEIAKNPNGWYCSFIKGTTFTNENYDMFILWRCGIFKLPLRHCGKGCVQFHFRIWWVDSTLTKTQIHLLLSLCLYQKKERS